MTRTSDTQRRLRKASSPADIFDAAYSAFSDMLSMIRRYQDGDGPFYAALVFAAAAAANGRDAMLFASSLPLRSRHELVETVVPGGSEPVAAELALLSEAVMARLVVAAAVVTVDGDRLACRDGVRHAREIHGLVTGVGP